MRTVLRRLHADESGQTMVMAAIFAVGLVAAAGLVADGGTVFVQRRDLQNVADAAALAGAMQVDEAAYRASAGAEVVLDENAARDAALAYLEAEEGLDYDVRVAPDGIQVSVRRQAGTGFLRALGIEEVGIDASASAAPRYGVEAAEP